MLTGLESRMTPELDLKALEKRVYTSFHQDGIIDIFVGLLLFVDGLLMLSGNAAFVGVAVVIVFLILPVKRVITVPRIGMAKFSPARNSQLTKFGLMLLIGGALVFMIFALRGSSSVLTQWMREYFDLVFGVMFALLAGAAAILTGLKRYIGYVVEILIIFTVGYLFNWPFPVALSITGALVSLSGVVTFIRFLQKYPKSDIPEEIRP